MRRKRSVPTVMTFPQKSSNVFSLSALSEFDLGDVSNLRACSAASSPVSQATSRCLRPLRILQLLLLLQTPADWRLDMVTYCLPLRVPEHRHCYHSLQTFPGTIFTNRRVRQCFAITALLSGFVPKSATFSSLLTLCTCNLCDLISPCTHKYATHKYATSNQIANVCNRVQK